MIKKKKRLNAIPAFIKLYHEPNSYPFPGHFMSESDFFNYSHVGHAIQITRKWHSKPLKSYPSSYQPPMQVNIVTNSSSALSSSPQQTVAHYNKTLLLPSQQLPTLPNWANFFISKPWIQRYLPNGNPIYFIEKLYPFFFMDHIPSQYFAGLQRARVYYEKEETEYASAQNQIVTESLIVK
jgi:hypothetical protein